MRPDISRTLQNILSDTAREIEEDKSRHSFKRVKQMMRDAPPLLPMLPALSSGHALIAEIKERSPSQGAMLRSNFHEAPAAYKQSRIVKAISVLTSRTHFGKTMRAESLKRIKEITSKPVLRKDFIIEEYQIYQARAFGADAILLMANVLDRDELRRLSGAAFEIGMDVLFETHRASELEDLPESARIIGINCRNFDGGTSRFRLARFFRQWLIGVEQDHSVNTARFTYSADLPPHVVKVAESGVTSKNCLEVFSMGFSAVLVGTSILLDKRGASAALNDFEAALTGARSLSRGVKPSLHPASA